MYKEHFISCVSTIEFKKENTVYPFEISPVFLADPSPSLPPHPYL